MRGVIAFLLSLGTRLLALAGALLATALVAGLVYGPAYFLLVELAARTATGPGEALGVTLCVLLGVFAQGVRERLRDPDGLAGATRLDDAFDTAGRAQARADAEAAWRAANLHRTGGAPTYPYPGGGGGGRGGSVGGWILGLLRIALLQHGE